MSFRALQCSAIVLDVVAPIRSIEQAAGMQSSRAAGPFNFRESRRLNEMATHRQPMNSYGIWHVLKPRD